MMALSKLCAIAFMCLALAGCNGTALVCGPPLKHYTAAELHAAKVQYLKAKAAGDMEVVVHMIDDYGLERAAIRYCQKHKRK